MVPLESVCQHICLVPCVLRLRLWTGWWSLDSYLSVLSFLLRLTEASSAGPSEGAGVGAHSRPALGGRVAAGL